MSKEVKVLSIVGGVFAVIFVGMLLAEPFVSKSPVENPNKVTLIGKAVHHTNEAARVKVVEFGDYQCPACALAYVALKNAEKQYGSKIDIVFRNFPLPQHKNGLISAEAAEAAGAQGKFWQMHDILYEKQTEWNGLVDPRAIFENYAKDLGLDVTRFRQDLGDKAYSKIIDQDTQDGKSLQVVGTPTIFVNGVQVEYGSGKLNSEIDQALSKGT